MSVFADFRFRHSRLFRHVLILYRDLGKLSLMIEHTISFTYPCHFLKLL